MRLSDMFEYLFQLVVWITPAITIVMLLILLARRMLGNRQDPRLFYVLWIGLTIRLLIPWFPASEFSLWSAIPSFPTSGFMLPDIEHQPQGSTTTPLHMESILLPHQDFTFNWMQMALWIWLLGAIGVASFFLIVHGRFRRALIRHSTPIDRVNHHLRACLEQCREKLGIRTSISLSMTSLVSSPAVMGLFQPKILIPSELEGKLNHQEWTCIFMHELTHIRRKDVLWNGLMILLVVIHWFNPFIWRAYLTMREDQELSCDATMKKHLHPIQYGRTLTKVIEIRSSLGRYSPISFISGSKITKRRMNMLFTKKRTLFSLLLVACIAIAAALIFTNPNLRANAESPAVEDSFVAPTEGTITARFGDERKQNVYDISITNQVGTPVYAITDGIVEKAGYESADGNQVVITHPDAFVSAYRHLDTILVEEGQEVKKGQQIGTLGLTGRSTGPHLSFGLMRDGQYIDPEITIEFRE